MKSTRNYLIVFFVVTTIAGMALAYREYLSVIELRTQLNDPTAGISKQLADAQKLIKELRSQLAAARSDGGDDFAAADDQGGDPAGDRGGGSRRQSRDAMRSLFNSPQMQALRSVQDKMRLNGTYGALFKDLAAKMNLSPEQVDQFKSLLVQRQQAMQDAYAAARAQGLNPRTDPEGFKAAIQAAQADVDNQIKATIGDAGFAEYQQYQKTIPERNTVNQLQQALSYTSTPLTDDQQTAMINLLQQNQKSSASATGGGGRGGFGGPPGGGGGAATINNTTVTQAASILSTSQLQALQQVQQAQQAQQQMESLMRAQAGKGGGTKTSKGGKGG